jgi:integrase
MSTPSGGRTVTGRGGRGSTASSLTRSCSRRAAASPPGRRNVLRAVQVQAEKPGLDGLGVHDLRHSCAGLLRDAGISDESIAVTLRHESSRVTAQMYGGRSEDAKARVRAEARAALA